MAVALGHAWAAPLLDVPPEPVNPSLDALIQEATRLAAPAKLTDFKPSAGPLVEHKSVVADYKNAVTQTTSQLVVNAMELLGVPYRSGGNSASTGFDCSGFVRNVYEKTLGLVLPRRAAEQAQSTETINKEDLKPGDLVFFNTMRNAFSHVGIYVGEGKFIHSPRAGGKVRIESMREDYWAKRFNGARRVTTDQRTNPRPGGNTAAE